MSQTNRIYKIHEMLRNARLPIPKRRFMEELEASENTVTRDFAYLRDFLRAPLEYCREQNGHQYSPDAPVFELPGFWMNDSELYALLACEQLLESVQPGLMARRLAPLKSRIREVLGEAGHNADQVSERVHIQATQVRKTPAPIFNPVAEATLACNQICFTYQNRTHGYTRKRTADPQRLLHYRSNWYLLANCQEARELRLFSLDRIKTPEVLNEPAHSLEKDQLDKFTNASFGIFGGKPIAVAHLKFTEHAAQWVADEQWHENQQSEWWGEEYHLKVPYSHMTELVMDILKYGPEVEVLGPIELREEVVRKIRGMVAIY